MNILLNEISEERKDLVEFLTSQPDISIYLSISQEDTLRIIRDIKPDATIFFQKTAEGSDLVRNLSTDFPQLRIYIYKNGTPDPRFPALLNLRNFEKISLDNLIHNVEN